MRPVAPLVFTGLKPASLAGLPGPDFDIVAPADLYIDDTYQRELSDKSVALIKRMVEGWSWAKFKAPICTRVDGQLHVLDGQHTAIGAATHGGIPLIPVLVVAAPHLADRADAFVSHATDRLSATPTQVHHAACAAGDKEALRLQRVIDATGMKLVLSPKPPTAYRPGETIAIKTIRGVIARRGDKLAKEVLSALVLAGVAPVLADDIKIADALLCEPDFAGEFDIERVAATLRAIEPKARQDAEQLAVAKRMPLWKALAAVLFRTRRARPKPTVETAPEAAPAGPAFASVLAPAPSAARVIDRRYRGVVPLGEPEPGRSALDERRRATA